MDEVSILSLYEFYKKNGEGEIFSESIIEALHNDKKKVHNLIDLFNKENILCDKELLANLLLDFVCYQPAIDFLKNEMNWTDEELSEFSFGKPD